MGHQQFASVFGGPPLEGESQAHTSVRSLIVTVVPYPAVLVTSINYLAPIAPMIIPRSRHPPRARCAVDQQPETR